MITNKILTVFLLSFLVLTSCSCENTYPKYEIVQSYDSELTTNGMVYDLTTNINKTTYNPTGEDPTSSVYESIVRDIPSAQIDSILLREKSIANTTLSEFKHLDNLTNVKD